MNLFVRKYGRKPYRVILLHGGPGVPGSLRLVAQRLGKKFGVLEHLQTARTILGQLREIKEIIDKYAAGPMIIVGHSWGAMLGYIFAAKYPKSVKKLILVGSGVYEKKYAGKIMSTRLSRMTKVEKKSFNSLMKRLEKVEGKEQDELFNKIGKILGKVDAFERLPGPNNKIKPSYQTYQKIWSELEEIRLAGRLLQMGTNISCPVVAIHGDFDPHPIDGIKKPLAKVLSDFSMIVLKNCGHEPWLEKRAEKKFYEILEQEIGDIKEIIVFFGVPGSGKSYLGRYLAEKINYYFYEADIDFNEGGYRERMVGEAKDRVLLDFYQKVAINIEKYLQNHRGVVVASALGTDKYRRKLEKIFGGRIGFVWVKPDNRKHIGFTLDRETKVFLGNDDLLVSDLKEHLKNKIRSFEKPTIDCLVIKNDYSKKTEKELLKYFVYY